MGVPLLRSIVFAIVFYTGSVFAVLGAFPVSLTGEARLRRYAVGWARFHRLCATYLLGVRSRVEGRVPTDPVLIAAKHQSMYETLELLVILDEPAVVLKQELADMPLWGRIAKLYGAIPVDREGSASALKAMVAAGKAQAATGRPILIFPEGTRVMPGETPPLRAGFAGLYRGLGLPVVPVALDSGRVWPRSFVKQPGVVTFRFGEPIPPGMSRREAEALTHAAINALEAAPV